MIKFALCYCVYVYSQVSVSKNSLLDINSRFVIKWLCVFESVFNLIYLKIYVFYIVIDTKLHLKKVNCDYFLFLYPIFPFSFSKLGMKNIKSRAGETVFRR